MTPSPLIEADRISKKFAMRFEDARRYGIRDFCRITCGLRRAAELRPGEFYALRDVSFAVNKGENFAILGRNGAGKSTLLTLMTGRMLPDEGHLAIRGRIGVLAIGSFGFRLSMSGRENILLKGITLGISKADLKNLVPEIIEFSEIGAFIDAPMRTYSAGMVARLGFAIAINVRPDILLADEALSAGDVAFAQKCAEQIEAMREHMTFVIVTHSPDFAAQLCDKAIVLHQGQVVFAGTAKEAAAFYQDQIAHAKTGATVA